MATAIVYSAIGESHSLDHIEIFNTLEEHFFDSKLIEILNTKLKVCTMRPIITYNMKRFKIEDLISYATRGNGGPLKVADFIHALERVLQAGIKNFEVPVYLETPLSVKDTDQEMTFKLPKGFNIIKIERDLDVDNLITLRMALGDFDYEPIAQIFETSANKFNKKYVDSLFYVKKK